MGGYNVVDKCGSCRTWKCSYLVGKRKVFIKDEAQIAERAVLYLG